jgi:hypothetical protein
MAFTNASFDDSSDKELHIFSGYDLLIAHYDIADLAWEEVAERTVIDERRGLVVLQVAVLEDLIDDFIMRLADEPHQEEFYATLTKKTIGPRLEQLTHLLEERNLIDSKASELLVEVRTIVQRRNELAHGTIHYRPVGGMPPLPLKGDIEFEWVISSRRSPEPQRLTMSQLREDLYEAIGCFMALLAYSDRWMAQVPPPRYFKGGHYLGTRATQEEDA